MRMFLWMFMLCLAGLPATAAERSTAAQRLLEVLRATASGGSFLFGQANALNLRFGNTDLQSASDYRSDLLATTGAQPGFVESDLMWHDNPHARACDLAAMREANRLGIVCGYCWHMRGRYAPEFSLRPAGASNRELAREILARPDRAGNPALDWFLHEYDTRALPVFRELEFPLVFRPLHEMNGDWFWWGASACTPEEYIRLYRLVVTHLRQAGATNLLFAWSPDKTLDLRYYPGDDYVDIVGLDAYEPGIAQHYPASVFARELRALCAFAAEHGKVAALTETGCREGYPERHPDFWTRCVLPAAQGAGGSGLAYVMAWYNADWNRDGRGTAFTPYPGIESRPGGAEAIADMLRFRNAVRMAGDVTPPAAPHPPAASDR